MKVEVTVLGSPSLISHMVSVDVKHTNNKQGCARHWNKFRCPCMIHIYIYVIWQITPRVSLYEVTRTSETQEMMGLWERAGGGENCQTT